MSMSEKTYGGHTVAALREFLQHGDDTGETIDELTGDESSSANIIRDLLAAIPSDAAQAPIYQYRMVSGEWIDFPEQDGRMHIERGHTVRIVYAAPVAPQAAGDAAQAPRTDGVCTECDGSTKIANCPSKHCPQAVQPDERAAFDKTDLEWLEIHERVKARVPNIFGGYMKLCGEYAREVLRIAHEARATTQQANKGDERAAFEAWAVKQPRHVIKDIQRYSDDWPNKAFAGQYGHCDTRNAWEIWQAARATAPQADKGDERAASSNMKLAMTPQQIQALYLLLLRRQHPEFGWMEEPLVAVEAALKPAHDAIHDRSFNAMNRQFFGDDRFRFNESPMPVELDARAAAPQAVTLSDEQRKTVEVAAARVESSGKEADRKTASKLRALLAVHPTEQRTSDAEDAARLDWLREECCDLRSISVPTGGDDADVNWIVIQHHMAEPREREIGRGFSDDPRDAIDAARKGDSHG